MKKNLFFTALLGLGLTVASCSSEKDAPNAPETENGNNYAQLVIDVASAPQSRAANGDAALGETYEYDVQSVTVVLTDINNIARHVLTTTLKTESTTAKAIRATEPFLVPGDGSYKVYVLANYEENKANLSPIVVGSTDMTQTFTIYNENLNAGTSNKFFMTNCTEPVMTNFTSTATTTTEVDDDGTTVSGGKSVVLIDADIERVVSKVTFAQSTTAFDVMDGSTKVATADVKEVGLINLNKKTYMVKREAPSFTPSASFPGYIYVVDPNYSYLAESALNANFSTPSVTTFSALSSHLYCPENTMEKDAQKNGQTTGVVYQVKFTPEDDGITRLSATGTDQHSKKYAAVLGATHDAEITNTMFEGAINADGTFYEYNKFIFVSEAAAKMYAAIDQNLTADAAAINTAYATGAAALGVHEYAKGNSYYTAWIKANPQSTVKMELGRFGTVRNHWYDLTVTKIGALGHYEPTFTDPEDPDDKEEALIQVQATIKQWVWVHQDVEL